MLALVKGTFHRITRAYGSQEPLDIAVSREDRRILRKLGQKIADGGFQSIANVEADEILMSYENR